MEKEHKLDRNNIENFMELTSLQQGMLFHYISDELSTEYHEQLSLTIIGDLKINLLQKAWEFVIENNEMLRTIFRWKGIDKPIQIVLKKHKVLIEYTDLVNESNKHNALENIKLKDLSNRIDITKETLRIYLCRLDNHKYEMIISNHHILYDGWSNGIILKELMEAYTCLYENKELKQTNKGKFSEFIKFIKGLNKLEQKTYWQNSLKNSEIDNDCFSSKENGYYKETSYKIDKVKENNIKDFAKSNKLLLSSILYGAWGILIQKLSNTNDILFGTTVSGRTENIKSIDNMVGLFINTIPLRVKTEKHTTLINLIHNLDMELNKRKSFENTSLIDIKEYCNLKTNENIFNSIVTIENYPLDLNGDNVLSIENFSIVEKTNYNMALEILTFNGIEFKFKFNSKAINEAIVKNLGGYLETIINVLLSNPNIKISDVDLLSENEREKILYEFNNTNADYSTDKTLQELFELQVEKTPNNVAIVFEGAGLTYKELNERANSIGRILRGKGVKRDTVVGLMVERSLEMIIGILGILKAGGAYLPIDPRCPKERIEFMLKDSKSTLLLSQKNLFNSIEFSGEIIDLFNSNLFTSNLENLEKINDYNDLAYIIYTSGTTGNPKGVMIEHRSVINLVQALAHSIYSIYDIELNVALVAPYYFDASVQQIFGAILNGCTLYIVPEYTRKNGQELIKYYELNKIDISDGTPTHLSMMANSITRKNNLSLKHLIIGGDSLKVNVVQDVYNILENIKISNVYGPTECSVDSSSYLIEQKSVASLISIPIGKPLKNYKFYVVDKNNKLLPIGSAGELCISGVGLARGYLNNPELTEEKFINNPFELGIKMYKTGDLVKWLPDGNIEFLGRIDNQVKINGFRIELAEIENKLLEIKDVKEAVVIAREEKEKYLCAYVVSEKEVNELNLRGYIGQSLPEYMIPTYFIQVENMPLTANGKIDKKSLPKPAFNISLNKYEKPRNEIEEALTKIWSEVLEIPKIGINDNFFELGGHSLKATMLISRIHKRLNKEVPIKELFKSPTIKELSEFIGRSKQKAYSKILKVEDREYFEASSAQKRMYVIQEFDKDSVAYNMPVVFEIKGEFSKTKIEETFKKLTLRHEALRTYFDTSENEIVQKLDNSYEFELLTKKDNTNIDNIVNNFIRPFNLKESPLFRVELVENENKTYLLIDMHHIISDGVSAEILIREFIYLYNGQELEVLKLQYKDFAAWQNKFLNSEEMKKQEEYWVNKFNDEIPVLNMPTDYERPSIQSFEGDSIRFEIEEKTTKNLRELSKKTGTTMQIVLLSAFNILLSKYSGQKDIVVGIPIAGRPHADIQNIIGMFVNTLGLRNKPEGDKKYIDFLKEVSENSFDAYENQSYQLEALVEKLDLTRDTSRNPLFDVMFNMVDIEAHDKFQLDGALLKQYDYGTKISKFDLTLNALEDKTLKFSIDYCVKLFDKATIERLSKHFVKVLNDITNNPEIKLCEIDLLSEKEKTQMLCDFNNTKTHYDKGKTIQDLFEAQVEKTPDNIAVVFEDKKLTYRELNERSNKLARLLRDKGVEADTIVGIMIERSLEMIVGIIGVLKSGGAYLPIDPNYPKERIEYMLKDSESKILLSKSELVKTVEFNGHILDLCDETLFNKDPSNLYKINNSSNLAYIIYTSGTTGKPKGTMIEHRSLVNRLSWMQKKYPIDKKDTILQKTTYTFDVSVWEILWWSLVGAKVCMLSPNAEKDPMKIIEAIDKYKVTTIHFVPSMLDVFLYCVEENRNNINLSSLRQVFSSGETLNFKQVSKFYKEFERDKKLINLYGPTEATIDVSYFDCDNNSKRIIPIGKPIDNTELYVLKNNELVPIGVAGELCISGDGLARGYLNKAELTSEKFVANPFNLGTKMYKTGDLVRWLPDGNIEFLGRIDNQVKVRGFRIELGEIENRLLQHEDVKEVAVLVKEDKNSEKYICAYIVSEENLKDLDLKGHLKERLPEYMIPAYFVKLEKMPLTANGKLDRRALPNPNLDEISNKYEAPRNKLEETLTQIWSEVLGIKNVGINDNFFELGGHSLKASVLMSKIHKELNKEVPLKKLFQSPTIKELSNFIESSSKNLYSKIEKVEESEYYETSSAQKRMYMLQKFDKYSTAYNIPVVFEIKGKVDKDKIEQAFKHLTIRHESLRTYFETFNGEIIQKLQDKLSFKLVFKKENKNIEDIINKFVRPFDLEKCPLFRVELIENKEKTYLLIDMHHIISDGVSMSILIKEFTELYSGKSLPPLKLQYKDFSIWQNSFLKSQDMKNQEEYWTTIFNDEIPVLNMPTDYERPSIQSFQGGTVNFEIDEKLTERLRKLATETGSTMHMVLLSAFTILLSKYSGQEDLIVGTPIAGRPHADLQNIVGMFVNTLALRNKPTSMKEYLDFLNEVKENSLKAYENQSYQLEALIEKLDVTRDTSRNPLFDVMFNMIDTVTEDSIKLNDILLKQYDNENKISKFDLTLNALEKGNTLNFKLYYCSKLFNKKTIEKLSRHFVRILETITSNIKIKICDIDLLSENEKSQILYKFNDTSADYPKCKTIQQLFEKQAEKTPDNIAVIFKDKKLTYRELNEQSNLLARILRSKGVKRDSIVGIMIERSPEMIIGMLAILKSGGAYLPIDPKLPKNRIDYMIKDSQTNIVITSKELAKRIAFNGVILDISDENIYYGNHENLDIINTSNDLAYIIYTSGTTGNPKGVMVEHNNVVRLMFNEKMPFKFNDKDVWTMFHSYCFDFSVWEMYGALLYGGKLVLVPEVVTKDFEKYLSLLSKEKVTILNQTPTAFYNLMNIELSSNKTDLRLRYIIFGGESLNPKMLYRWKEKYKETKLINMYGITETTVHVTYKELGDLEFEKGISNIGKPIPTLTTYVMNKDLQLQPIGVPGELCVGGDGVARGYLNRDVLTKEKFVVNPYIENERMYRSGDLVKLLENGELEYLGRIDNQVKIRGFRIEIGEITNKLLQHKYIKEAAVIVKNDKENEKYLCAYIVSEKNIDDLNLKNYLKESLPEYMIPSYFIQLTSMPLTSNGKLDKKSLPQPNLDNSLNRYEPPKNEIEKKLSRIWEEVLGISKIGVKDNFFELGGHSLKATVLISKIHKELNREIPLKELFKSQTIRELSEFIEKTEDNPYSKIEKVEERDYYDTSSAQRRMYMLQNFDKSSVAYNMPVIFELDGEINKKRIEETFKKLLRRHEALTTYFKPLKNKIVQKIDNYCDFNLSDRKDDSKIEDIVTGFVRPFILEKSPLFRAELVQNINKFYLLIDMHHIISDGVSMSILIKEFLSLYNGEYLEPLKLQYKDFSKWQNDFLKSENVKKQEEYWIDKFSDETPVLNLQYDYKRPKLQSFKGDSVIFKIDYEITQSLKDLSMETGTTMHMIMLSIFNILLSKYSGQKDIIVGVPIAGRPHADLQNIIGIFVNTLALRNKPEGEKKYLNFLIEVKENCLKAYENQSYQLETLLEKLNIKSDGSRNPLFDVIFNSVNYETQYTEFKADELTLKQHNIESTTTKFDLSLTLIEKEKMLELELAYCSELFNRETIEGMVENYLHILQTIIMNKEITINNINLKQLQDFNCTSDLLILEDDFSL